VRAEPSIPKSEGLAAAPKIRRRKPLEREEGPQAGPVRAERAGLGPTPGRNRSHLDSCHMLSCRTRMMSYVLSYNIVGWRCNCVSYIVHTTLFV
jgi:hypothetical protein